MLSGMDVEHEIDQCALHACAGTREERKTGAGNLRCPFEVQNAQRRTQVPVSLWLKVESRRLPDPADLDVLFFAWTDRHRGVRQIRNSGSELEESFFNGAERFLFF